VSEQPETPVGQPVPGSTTFSTPTDSGSPQASSSSSGGGPAAVVQDRPEVAVGAAFAGGFVLALILKRLGSRD
jgi:hypothetical protein